MTSDVPPSPASVDGAPVETDRTTTERPSRIDDVERLLADQGRDLGFARARVAVGRSGIALGFPKDPMLHVSWWVLSGLVLVTGALLVRRR
jgi:hypothetical protein